jgi:hypothetical protein
MKPWTKPRIFSVSREFLSYYPAIDQEEPDTTTICIMGILERAHPYLVAQAVKEVLGVDPLPAPEGLTFPLHHK